MENKKILVTGATGFIASHTCVELIEAGYKVVGIDNFANSKPEVLNKIKAITGVDIAFYEGDVNDANILKKIFLSMIFAQQFTLQAWRL